ncbi:hypothetical protein LTR91_022652 [Friedmanniomyces endolithicus]|uniref:Fungal death-pathway protein SesB domain-containing protein n=1 Tax=Friedmanniomyces endolithicus TaxID=329885 RepID=A0AAN6K456_9PEZI|nr:hypothetical protein LTR35_017566 [Friedmanniomyces endolithicus]KAK0268870.1 hypothetical protein LTS00_017445 [Friedmanniomyces endolithicus]KAK0302534.1 hypothetical protein LTR82_017837 [Friedmanniomyces endolithicus]KAK0954527.1 hypothetical protein LTS01_023871 [Friedmanniomyces endolithicus]KAK0955855.1 hypothetical protein LTR91_022652 [Friedmanniomyces endolithicus]
MSLRDVNASFGNHNSGFQLAQNSGTINFTTGNCAVKATFGRHSHFDAARPETPPDPLSTVPFPHDPDYVDCGPLIDEIDEKLGAPAARVALVGLGGVG